MDIVGDGCGALTFLCACYLALGTHLRIFQYCRGTLPFAWPKQFVY